MLSAVSGVYDLLGVAAPVVITGKILYSETCLRKLKWDEQVPDDIWRSWKKWLTGLEECPVLSVPRSVMNKDVTKIVLHGFSDASSFSSYLRSSISYSCSGLSESPCCKVEDSSREL